MDSIRIGEILAPVSQDETRRREQRVRAGLWSTVRRAAGKIPFMDEVVASYYCAIDSRTPYRARATLLAALAYFVLPFDIMPDFLAVIGFTDDMAVLMAAITAIRPHIKDRHRQAARAMLDR